MIGGIKKFWAVQIGSGASNAVGQANDEHHNVDNPNIQNFQMLQSE